MTQIYKLIQTTENHLYSILEDIERFYYSPFWENRFKCRLKEEGLNYNPIELDKILGATTCLKENIEFIYLIPILCITDILKVSFKCKLR